MSLNQDHAFLLNDVSTFEHNRCVDIHFCCVDLRQYWPLQAGEAYLVDNYRWLHARTDFEDDPKAPRLLFRLWLQVEHFDS